MQRYGRHALWPSQAATISGGLLDRGHPALAIKMPTSAGKTALIELLVADTLDSSPGTVVAVLAPTKALVSQLSSPVHVAAPRASVACFATGRRLSVNERRDPAGPGRTASPIRLRRQRREGIGNDLVVGSFDGPQIDQGGAVPGSGEHRPRTGSA